MINKAGGVKVGGKAEKLELKILDNQSDNNLAVRQYVQLVTQDKVNLLLGPFASDAVIATSSVAEKYQVPMVQGGGASDQIYSRGYKYIFGTLPAATKYFESTIEAMGKLEPGAEDGGAALRRRRVRRVGRARARATCCKAARPRHRARRALQHATRRTSPRCSRASRARTPTRCWSRGHETEILNFIRQAKSLDVSPKIYSFTVGVPSADFRKALGKDAELRVRHDLVAAVGDATDKYFGNAEKFAQDYKARFGYEPDYHAASAVADVETYVKAIEAAGSTDPQKVRDEVAKVSFDSLYGPIKFDAKGQISLPQVVIQVQDGKVVPIYSGKGFIDKPRYPMPAWDKR